MSRGAKPRPPRLIVYLSAVAMVAVVLWSGWMLTVSRNSAPAEGNLPDLDALPEPVDPQSWVFPAEMTWDDYTPLPGIDWSAHEPETVLRGALVLGDFPNHPFVVTLPEGSDVAGNPRGIGSVPRDALRDFWLDYLNTPQQLNGYQSISAYWRENSYGKWSIELTCFGPYELDFDDYQYGLGEGGGQEYGPDGCPANAECGKDFLAELMAKSEADRLESGIDFDFSFGVHAGYSESSVWQEFGEMRFATRDTVTDEFGPPPGGGVKKNWASTRYAGWTSWWAASALWPQEEAGISQQAESSGQGTYAHEFAHVMGAGDNYNSPYGVPPCRSLTGPWELMSRGGFNGPGGPHMRWLIPANMGSAVGSHMMLRNKELLGLVDDDEVLVLNRDELATTGPVFADVWAREVPLGEGFGRDGLHGIRVALTGGDMDPEGSPETDDRCPVVQYHWYTLEVVDRMGADSFVPGHCVLLAKANYGAPLNYSWVIDAHPEDLNRVDYTRPNGQEVLMSPGDYRQLSDALFHAGTGEGVVDEFVDEANRLHFYVLDANRDADGVLRYRVAVRSLDFAGYGSRGLAVKAAPTEQAAPGRVAVQWFEVTNTGSGDDIVRLDASTDAGWELVLQYNLVEVGAGKTVRVPVYVAVPSGGEAKPKPTILTLTATSETDPGVTVSVRRDLVPAKVGK